MKLLIKSTVVALALGIGFAAPAWADVVICTDFGPLDSYQTSTGTAWAVDGSMAATTGTPETIAVACTNSSGTTYELTDFQFAANSFNGTNSLTAAISSSLTGSALESFTITATTQTVPQIFTADLEDGLYLSPGQTDYIILSAAGTAYWGWQWNDMGDVGLYYNQGGPPIYPLPYTTPAFDLAGNAVPEPITISLFGAGLIGLGALRRRKAIKKV